MADTMIQVKNLNVHYSNKLALEDVTISIPTGQITGIIGPNGAGKSTLVKSMLGLIDYQGTVSFGKNKLEDIQKDIAYVEQRQDLDLTFPINVFDTVLLGTYPKLGLIKRPGKKEKRLAKEALETVDMQEYSEHQISELSGGQLQRVFIARAIAQQPEWFFLDEPFVGIDVVSEEVIIDVLKKLRDQGKSMVIVHHDLSKVTKYFDHLVMLNKKVIADGPVDQVFTKKYLGNIYGTGFVEALTGGVLND
ncbi:MAG: metal ABC transporter ATP-binding protein [Tetragenococcus halophilus]|uniref:Iron/zinc/copper transport system ATP-binding protein n=1 Tax=Alkalibacterium gilvum TaxID=1130080 RepID=A0A1H6W5T8_9LACT|nr:metal ABC transporter ATP-binding protein [Alkalibacterium gilvum]MDN6204129.1 metal ABC transporter ATP-binding protein [Tetragenococcus halophilus]MDN6345230.1 metal ABC transporter ATP-binding protein [Tetragenococcus koreensis]MDN6423517.1 metal ABC transporter ATP-binding protein [Tetragenococcus koreensis]SEJ08190.1 iron/zinc/copper transport system ATP-binding protein [Alkalibacterium gilvum]